MFNIAKNNKRPFRIAILAYRSCMGTEIFAIADVLLIATHIANAMGKTMGKAAQAPPYCPRWA